MTVFLLRHPRTKQALLQAVFIGKVFYSIFEDNRNLTCPLCKRTDCKHTKFALSIPEVTNKVLELKNWSLTTQKP